VLRLLKKKAAHGRPSSLRQDEYRTVNDLNFWIQSLKSPTRLLFDAVKKQY
jgi:hypothetical protein